MAKPKLSAEDRKWMAQNDANALVTADEIKADTARMKGVAGHIKRQEKALKQQKKKYVAPKPKRKVAKKVTRRKGNKR